MTLAALRCWLCAMPLGDHHLSLDRNVRKYVVTVGGTPGTVVDTLNSWAMRLYDDDICRQADEEAVVNQLGLQSAFPGEATVVPCSRCGTSVDRRHWHVSYDYTEYRVNRDTKEDGTEVLKVMDSRALAVLCRDCEEPDVPGDEFAAELQQHQERTRT